MAYVPATAAADPGAGNGVTYYYIVNKQESVANEKRSRRDRTDSIRVGTTYEQMHLRSPKRLRILCHVGIDRPVGETIGYG